MSSAMRGSGRSLGDDIVRRMVNLPRSILGGFSRVMGRRHQNHPQNFSSPQPLNFPFQDPSYFQDPSSYPMIQEEWAFLATFEQQYGIMHPFFYACRFKDALNIAQNEHKFLFMYIHSPEHPFTASFSRETLCSELVVQFLDANFVCWGGLASRGEGLQMAATLRASSFPFCAVVAPSAGDNLAVLRQIEGPVSAAELLEILQRTIEEQGLAFGSGRAKQEEKRREDRRLREEQDAAYLAALKIDQEKERLQKKEKVQKQPNKAKPATITTAEASQKENRSGGTKAEVTQILIRFPNGERREHSFLCTDKIQAIFRYVDSLGLTGAGSYRFVSNFPRKVYSVDEMGMSLKEAGLHPKASLFLELI